MRCEFDDGSQSRSKPSWKQEWTEHESRESHEWSRVKSRFANHEQNNGLNCSRIGGTNQKQKYGKKRERSQKLSHEIERNWTIHGHASVHEKNKRAEKSGSKSRNRNQENWSDAEDVGQGG